jgi:hypothetical protein
MNMRISASNVAVFAFGGLLTLGVAATFADRGRGSIRAAAPAPREAVHQEPAQQPRDVHPVAHGDTHPEVRPDVHAEAHPQPSHAAPPPQAARRDWDDNDEDARHFGGFANGAPAHLNRGERIHALPARNIHLHQPETDGEYLVVQPPVGVVVAAVPSAATSIAVGPTTYWYLDGVFYVAQGNAFAVVNPPAGIVVPTLPSGAAQTVANGNVVYQFNGFDYQPSIQDGVTAYTVNPA